MISLSTKMKTVILFHSYQTYCHNERSTIVIYELIETLKESVIFSYLIIML